MISKQRMLTLCVACACFAFLVYVFRFASVSLTVLTQRRNKRSGSAGTLDLKSEITAKLGLQYERMCGNKNSTLSSGKFIDVAFSNPYESSIIGLEAWTQQSIYEFAVSEHLWTSKASFPFWDLKEDPRSFVLTANDSSRAQEESFPFGVYISININTPSQISRLNRRLEYVGIDQYTAIELDKNSVLRMKELVEKRFYEYFPLHSEMPNHHLATYSAIKFFAEFNRSRLQEALYLESDVVPVQHFREKFQNFYDQLHRVNPDYDLAFLGTCFGIDMWPSIENRYRQISRNVFLINETRCFNALLVSKKGARKIMQNNLPLKNFTDIDHTFNRLIGTLVLNTVHARQPLFFEESKANYHLFC